MKKRMLSFWDRWGYYALAVLCAAVILLSAGWTNRQRLEEKQEIQAAADESQRLSEAQERIWQRPVTGEILRPFSEKPLLFEQTGLWQVHVGVDFAVEEGDVVVMTAGIPSPNFKRPQEGMSNMMRIAIVD